LTEDYFDFDLYDIPEDGVVLDFDEYSSDNLVVLYKEDFENQKELFEKIFLAVGLKIDKNLVILKLEKGQHINLGTAIPSQTKQVICFGIAQSNLGINAKFKAYQQYKTESFAIMLSHSLTKLSDSKDHKKALWESLKSIYGQ